MTPPVCIYSSPYYNAKLCETTSGFDYMILMLEILAITLAFTFVWFFSRKKKEPKIEIKEGEQKL